jgi:alkaline phosphatase
MMTGLFARILSVLFVPLSLLSGWLGGGDSGTATQYKSYKNVVILIGDGMGQAVLDATKKYAKTSLCMETLPVKAWSDTNAFAGTLTDSAAGGTALACGIRTIDGIVARHPFDPLGLLSDPLSISELAILNRKSAGVVTTDSTSGATPAAFSAHALARSQEKKISQSQLNSDLKLIWGAASDSVNPENSKANGFTYVSNKNDWRCLSSKGKSFAQFPYGDLQDTVNTYRTPTLAEMTSKALDILDDNKTGFFLMVEGAHIDKYSHDNNLEGAMHAVLEFDKAVRTAVNYANTCGNTLVLVTADHETGGIRQDKNGAYVYTTTGHTNTPVPVFVNVRNAGFANGKTYLNRQIGTQCGRVLDTLGNIYPSTLIPGIRIAAMA